MKLVATLKADVEHDIIIDGITSDKTEFIPEGTTVTIGEWYGDGAVDIHWEEQDVKSSTGAENLTDIRFEGNPWADQE